MGTTLIIFSHLSINKKHFYKRREKWSEDFCTIYSIYYKFILYITWNFFNDITIVINLFITVINHSINLILTK